MLRHLGGDGRDTGKDETDRGMSGAVGQSARPTGAIETHQPDSERQKHRQGNIRDRRHSQRGPKLAMTAHDPGPDDLGQPGLLLGAGVRTTIRTPMIPTSTTTHQHLVRQHRSEVVVGQMAARVLAYVLAEDSDRSTAAELAVGLGVSRAVAGM